MVPMVETVEQAEKVAKAARYPMKGTRGTGGLFAPVQGNFGVDGRVYMNHANEMITVIVQIESPLGVENCEAIAGVDGIDALFIGPNDLASSMGFFAFDHARIPEVQEAGRKVLKAAKGKGKFAGYFCLNAEDAARRIEEGWGFVNLGADIVALTSWMGSEMGKLKGLIGMDEGR
ncbi:2-keto-3-deoxy-L-rhamnonate aldolase [Pseudocercospora fuligena]|uniref:2-keto-3-deoxy-L-rhamnonate aldolase n=1 Tax=Pseudocercospora fuligena TaxID=685502 RepID=A0A8H6RIW2_9PEZI|nr:2-keto-3-deoxy-L-rhamnonate aldolase [Pseudocercospora fuligena]